MAEESRSTRISLNTTEEIQKQYITAINCWGLPEKEDSYCGIHVVMETESYDRQHFWSAELGVRHRSATATASTTAHTMCWESIFPNQYWERLEPRLGLYWVWANSLPKSARKIFSSLKLAQSLSRKWSLGAFSMLSWMDSCLGWGSARHEHRQRVSLKHHDIIIFWMKPSNFTDRASKIDIANLICSNSI